MSHETPSSEPTSTTPLLRGSSESTGWGYTSYRKWLQFRTGRAGTLCASFFRIPLNKFFLWLHLASVLPAALLAVIQFIPRVRARAMSFHRTSGKAVNVLTFIATLSAWGIERVSFGGDLGTQAVGYVFGTMVLWSMIASWKAIRRLQIDEHRIWIIRAWGYQMSIMTTRVVMVAAMIYMLLAGGFYQSMSCQEVEFILNGTALYERDYPQCWAEGPASRVTHVAVGANLSGLGVASALRQTAAMGTWVALWIHAIGVEYYLYRTKDESDRLREVSTKRQHARRMLEERQSDNE
ncbi:hypothetical protein BDV93DRAFT_520546 [Ceratobasidium sp. AG-I]|nr:hypothetical protein BDV93DRAFT_520546 [Ceratobasidium sp. AG-I]